MEERITMIHKKSSLDFHKIDWISIYAVFRSIDEMKGREHNMHKNLVREYAIEMFSRNILKQTIKDGQKDFIGVEDRLIYEFKHVGRGLVNKKDKIFTKEFELCNPYSVPSNSEALNDYYHDRLKDKIDYLMVNDDITNSFYVFPFSLFSPDKGTIFIKGIEGEAGKKSTIVYCKAPIESMERFIVARNINNNVPTLDYFEKWKIFINNFLKDISQMAKEHMCSPIGEIFHQ
jgi:hypothetical protein